MCTVADFLNQYTNGDREQLAIILDDRTRSPHMIAKSFHEMHNAPSGVDIMKHNHGTCDCHGFLD